ncbi:MAG: hypothetical protein KGJ60_05475 [Verrucomicrobiota bacterium]|nr:hypothetical protein [Verrucomicrobiota bacterium]
MTHIVHRAGAPPCGWRAGFILGLLALVPSLAAQITVQPAGNQGFDVYANGRLVAPIRLAANGAIMADNVVSNAAGLFFSGLHTSDPLAVTFATNDYVSITLPVPADTNADPVVRFHLTLEQFNTNRWLALFPDGPAPFHFLVCSMPTAQLWHQRGWLNATPYADPFPLLQDVHAGSPEISCLWNRNWSYICPLGGQPIPMIGLWDPTAALYVGFDFEGARATDQSARYIATAYCWRQGTLTNFITLAYPYGGVRYGSQVYPQGGEVLASWFNLIIDPNLPATEDPNERFQERLFARYTNALPRVPAMNDLGWIPGLVHLADFAGPLGVTLYGAGSETNFYLPGTLLLNGWRGEVEMPIDTAVREGDTAALDLARSQVESLLTNYARTFTVGGDACLFWQKPLAGAWRTNWGGPAVTTLHETEGWYAARVLVELFRYDRNRGQAKAQDLVAIDMLFNWARRFVWTRNEFADVPSSPFAIGGTLSTAFLLDYYFTFKNDPQRAANAQLALHLADNLIWRYLQIWTMDSDRSDAALDSAFLLEPNSGRDWAGLACANEVAWLLDSLTQVYVHTGDPRLRYYLRGVLQRWPALYQPYYRNAVADYGSGDFTEGLGLFDGSGPGRGYRYPYGNCQSLPLNDPVGNSTMRVVAGERACVAFDRGDQSTDVTDYRAAGDGACSFRIVSDLPGAFDVSFSYPCVNISGLAVTRVRDGITNVLTSQVRRPPQSPSSLYLSQLQNGDVITIGTVPSDAPTNVFDTSLVYDETNAAAATNGDFITLPLIGDYPLPQDWTNLDSFAGIIPGLRWTCGVPYEQGLHAFTNAVMVNASATAVLVAYAPPESQTLSREPRLTLDDGSILPMSGHPVNGWRGWPIIFNQMVLLDYAVLPDGHSLRQVNPNGTLVMGVTTFTGGQAAWQPVQAALTNASAAFVESERQRLAVLALKASFAQLPTGRIALLPLSTEGAGANFAAATGLDQKWDVLTEQQLVDSNQFNAAKYPLAFYLGGEDYVKTVVTNGDGKAAITRYLAGGGTLVILASGPFPFYYGYGPADQPGPADPLLPALGLPIQVTFEQAPAGIYMQRYTNQSVLLSVPADFPFPPGDQRLRSIERALVNPDDRYLPLVKAVDPQGNDYGDAAAFIAFNTGPASGGRILYVWSTLLSGPQGSWIMVDTVNWIVNATLRPPRPGFGAFRWPDKTHVAFNFNAESNLDYTVQSRGSLTAGDWAKLLDLWSAPSNRSLWFTDSISGTRAGYFRLTVGP